MKPKAIVLGIIFSLFIGSVFADEVDLEIKEVIIYPQSVSLVYEEGTQGDDTVFTSLINKNAYSDSIRVIGGAVSEISISAPKTSYSYITPTLTPTTPPVKQLLDQLLNKEIKIGEFTGVLVWITDSWIGLASDSGDFTSLSMSHVNKIESSIALTPPEEEEPIQPTPTTEKKEGLNITWVDNAGAGRKVEVSYMSGGLSWEPTYFLDAADENSRFEFWSKITNNFEDLNANIKLVGGKVRFESRGYYDYGYSTLSQRAMYGGESAAYASNVPSPSISSIAEYEVYDLGQKTSKESETKLIPIFADTVKPKKEYVWDTNAGDKVQRIYKIKNEGDKTWPMGRVKVYENGILTGEDSIEWTPKGREAKITIGLAPDIEVSKKTTTKKILPGSYYDYQHDSTLKLKNYKSESVEVLIIDKYPSNAKPNTFEASDEYTEKPGNLMYWNVTLSPGQEKVITYTYITD